MKLRILGNAAGGSRVLVRFTHQGQDHTFGWGLEEFKQLLLSLKGQGADNLGEKGPIAFEELVDEFERLHGRSLRAWESADKYRARQLKGHFGDMLIHRMSQHIIEKYKSSLLTAGASNIKTNRLVDLLKTVLQKAVRWNYLKNNPAASVDRLPEQGRERALSRREYAKLLAHCDPWLHSLVVVAANTGLRRGELLNLKWSHVDFESRRICVVRTKTDRPRYIPMNSDVFDSLKKTARRLDTDYVYSQAGCRVGSFKRRWRTVVDAAGLGDLHFHDLRHTFTTWLSERGYNPMVIMALTGHSTAQMLKKYSNISDPIMTQAVQDLLSPGPQPRSNTDSGKGVEKGA